MLGGQGALHPAPVHHHPDLTNLTIRGASVATIGGQRLVYSPKRTRISRVMMPVMTKVTTVPTMPAIWASRRCWKGHC